GLQRSLVTANTKQSAQNSIQGSISAMPNGVDWEPEKYVYSSVVRGEFQIVPDNMVNRAKAAGKRVYTIQLTGDASVEGLIKDPKAVEKALRQLYSFIEGSQQVSGSGFATRVDTVSPATSSFM